MPAPVVQNLQDIIGEYANAFAPQQQVIDQQIADNDTAGKAQIAGLGAQKDQAFTDITQQSNNRGMFFSGFTPDQEAKYTAATYLPALANLQATIASTRSNLMGKKADLTVQGNTSALSRLATEQDQLQTYNNQQDQFAFTKSEREAGQAFQDQELQKTQAFQASQAAADRAAASAQASIRASSASGSQPSAAQIQQADAASLAQKLAGVAGKDHYVSPNDYLAAKNAWVQGGYSAKTFDDQFSNFRNPSNKYYKVG